jgi:hypothetical protein
LDYLGEILKKRLDKLRLLELSRNQIVGKITSILESSSIEYLFFKTFNEFGAVGVDVDLLIPRDQFSHCVSVLRADGFYPIDSLSKTYATGFRMRGNPTIVDLHTDLAVLGVSYLSPRRLLSNSVFTELGIGEPSEKATIRTKVLDPRITGVVTMAHSVLKEHSIRASDFIETHRSRVSDPNLFRHLVEINCLQAASDIFGRIALMTFPAITNFREMLFGNKDSFLFGFSRSSFERNVPSTFINLPAVVPPLVSAAAFLDCVARKRELTRSIPTAMAALRFPRNSVIAGHKILGRLLGE